MQNNPESVIVPSCIQNSRRIGRRIARFDRKTLATTLAWPFGGGDGGFAVVSFVLLVGAITATAGNGGSVTSDSAKTGLGAEAGGWGWTSARRLPGATGLM